jgi:hypothetical protein
LFEDEQAPHIPQADKTPLQIDDMVAVLIWRDDVKCDGYEDGCNAFEIGKVLALQNVLGQDHIEVQWYGNLANKIQGTWKPTWLHGSAKQYRYEHNTRRPNGTTPFCNKDVITMDQIIVYGFSLTLADKVPTPILRIIEDHPQVQWQLPELDTDDVFPRSTAPAISVPLTRWYQFVLPDGTAIPNSAYRVITDSDCGRGILAYGLTLEKLHSTDGYFTTTGPMFKCDTPTRWQRDRGIQLTESIDVYPPIIPNFGLLDLGLYINNVDESKESNCVITTLQRLKQKTLIQCLCPTLIDNAGTVSTAFSLLETIYNALPPAQGYFGEVKLLKDLPLRQTEAVFLRWKYNIEGVDGHFKNKVEVPKQPSTVGSFSVNHRLKCTLCPATFTSSRQLQGHTIHHQVPTSSMTTSSSSASPDGNTTATSLHPYGIVSDTTSVNPYDQQHRVTPNVLQQRKRPWNMVDNSLPVECCLGNCISKETCCDDCSTDTFVPSTSGKKLFKISNHRKLTFTCPQCEEVIYSHNDLEIHMVVYHSFRAFQR